MMRASIKPLHLLAALCGLIPTWALAQGGPKVITPTGAPPNPSDYRRIIYPWRQNITATIFWVGEKPSGRNRTSNHHSSWDGQWQKNFGGFDDPNPSARTAFRPKAFIPKQNTFYVALPYNDCHNHATHKAEAAAIIPWFRRLSPTPGNSVCHGRWLQIAHQGRSCYAQWEDCGPWTTDDWHYVFGNKRPANTQNGGAGIDVSPAVRDYLGLKSGYRVHWRFVEFSNVPRGPWAMHGNNNPFVNPEANPDLHAARRYNNYLRKLRDEAYQRKDVGRSR